jgi:CBS domain containing-hemolysin-like protein
MELIVNDLLAIWNDLGLLLLADTSRLAQPDMLIRLLLQALLLVASAFFSGSETALFSLSRLDLQRLRRERHPRVETLHALLDQPRRLIISILCGNEIINVAAAANMTGILVALYGDGRAGLLNMLIMVPLLLLFGEVTPKTIAVSDPVKVSTRIVAVPMSIWVKLVAPLRWVVREIADQVTTWIVGEEKSAKNLLKLDEFRTLVDEVVKTGELTSTERALIYNLLSAGSIEVVEIMIPRTRVLFINANSSVTQIVSKVRDSECTRLPVFRDSRDNVVGFIHAEDILSLVLDGTDLESVKLEHILRPLVAVIPTKKVDEVFDYLLAQKAQAAVVINEFGGVEGLITVRSALEYVFGQVAGAVAGAGLYERQEDGAFVLPGDMKLTVFNELTGFGMEDPRMTTIGGVILRYLDRVPEVGDEVRLDGIMLRVLEMSGLRVSRVSARRAIPDHSSADTPPSPDGTAGDE